MKWDIRVHVRRGDELEDLDGIKWTVVKYDPLRNLVHCRSGKHYIRFSSQDIYDWKSVQKQKKQSSQAA